MFAAMWMHNYNGSVLHINYSERSNTFTSENINTEYLKMLRIFAALYKASSQQNLKPFNEPVLSLSHVSNDFIITSIKFSPDQLSMGHSSVQKSTKLWLSFLRDYCIATTWPSGSCFYRAGGGQLSRCAPSLYKGINLVWEFDLNPPDDSVWLFIIFISQLLMSKRYIAHIELC